MATSTEIKQRANALADKTDVNSITPKEVGGIMYDLASHGENVLRNGGTLGIRKVYESVAAMEADSTNPKDFWGDPIKKGNLVVIYDGTTTGVDNNKIYAFMKPGWELATKLDAAYATKAETDAKLAELGSESNNVTLIGNGKSSFRKIVGLLANTLYRIYPKNKWTTPSVDSSESVFELYYKNDEGNFVVLHKVKGNLDNLKDFYEVTLPSNSDLTIWAAIKEGETATFVIEKINNTIEDVEFKKNRLNTYIAGKGVDYTSARFIGLVGRTYRINIAKKWEYPTSGYNTAASVFYIGKIIGGKAVEYVNVSCDDLINGTKGIRDFYDITIEADTEAIAIGGRCVEGDNMYIRIDDITDSINDISCVSSFSTRDMDSIGVYTPIKENGYILYSDFSRKIASNVYKHGVYKCKKGDVFFVKGKGGESARLICLFDEQGTKIYSSEANEDYSVLGIYYRCVSDGYIVFNVDSRDNYFVSKININIQKNVTPIFNAAIRVNWYDGYIDWRNGLNYDSTVNKRSSYITVMGYKEVRISMNVAAASVAPGLAFYDTDRNYLSGIQHLIGPETGVSVVEYNIPEGAHYIKTSLYSEYTKDFVCELISKTDDVPDEIKEFTTSVTNNVLIGSPSLYISDNVSDKYVSLNSKTIDDLYQQWDELIGKYPMFIRRGLDLGEVNDGTRSYIIRQYIVGYNGRYRIDHEPSQNEIVSENLWRTEDNPRKLLIVNGMHGNEKTPCWGAALAFEELLGSNDDWANFIKSNFDLYIIPCLNPYGFNNNKRNNINDKDLNREAGINEPERVAYMQWIEDNKDAFILVDNHGTQGRYAYIPNRNSGKTFGLINRITSQLSAALYNNYYSFYNSIVDGFADTYSPFLLAKYTDPAYAGSCTSEMRDRFGMIGFALETPDNLVVIDADGSVNESLSGLINYNDLRCCKITKDLMINFIQHLGTLPFNKSI